MMLKQQIIAITLLISHTLVVNAQALNSSSPSCILTSTQLQKFPVDLKQFSGQVIYIDFWASWCPPCAKSFPFLNQMHHRFQTQGLTVIGVNLDESFSDAKNFLEHYPADFMLATDDSKQCAKDFAVAAMPSSYLIDRQGMVRYAHVGFRAIDKPSLQAEIESLLAEPIVVN